MELGYERARQINNAHLPAKQLTLSLKTHLVKVMTPCDCVNVVKTANAIEIDHFQSNAHPMNKNLPRNNFTLGSLTHYHSSSNLESGLQRIAPNKSIPP